MNKAFVREPEPADEKCPQCGAIGQGVGVTVLGRYVPEELRTAFHAGANFCATPSCPVAYYDALGRTIVAAALLEPVWPKDDRAPLCACFGLTADDIEQDLAEGVVTRTKATVLRSQGPEARCSQCSPNGRPCTAWVQRYFIQRRG